MSPCPDAHRGLRLTGRAREASSDTAVGKSLWNTWGTAMGHEGARGLLFRGQLGAAMAGILAALFISGSITMDWATSDYAFAYPGVLQPSSADEGLYLSEDGPEKRYRERAHAAGCGCGDCVEVREYREFRLFKQARTRFAREWASDPPPYREQPWPAPPREHFRPAPPRATTMPAEMSAPVADTSAPPNSVPASSCSGGCSSCGDAATIKLMLLFIIIAIAAMAFGMAIASPSQLMRLTGAANNSTNQGPIYAAT